jgi:hypothetical protein
VKSEQEADLHLELELVRELTLLEAERSTKVVTEVGNTLDSGKDRLVNRLLVLCLALGVDGLLLLAFEELLLRTLLVADGLLGEVTIVELLINLIKSNCTLVHILDISIEGTQSSTHVPERWKDQPWWRWR